MSFRHLFRLNFEGCHKKCYNHQKASQTSPWTLGDDWVKRGDHVCTFGIQLKFYTFYMFSLFHPGTHNLSQHQKKLATLCSNFIEMLE